MCPQAIGTLRLTIFILVLSSFAWNFDLVCHYRRPVIIYQQLRSENVKSWLWPVEAICLAVLYITNRKYGKGLNDISAL